MTLREYIYFKRVFKEIEQKAGNISWVENFFDLNAYLYGGPNGRLDSAMPEIYNARNYEEVPDGCYNVGNVNHNWIINFMFNDMEILLNYFDKSLDSFNDYLDVETKHNTDLDYEYFQRMVSFFSNADSDEGKKINEQLSEVNKVLSAGNVPLMSDEYAEKINQLEKSLGAYLQESVFAGAQEKDTDVEVKALKVEDARRINAATAMKEYIGDIRKEKFKESMRQDIKKYYLNRVKPEDDELASSYAKKLAAIDAILANIDKMAEKHNALNSVRPVEKKTLEIFKENLKDTMAFLEYCKSQGYDEMKKIHGAAVDKKIAEAFVADVAINEILSHGGEDLSFSLSWLIDYAEHNVDVYSDYVRRKHLMDENEFTAFIKKSYKENVLDAHHSGLENLPLTLKDAIISDSSYRIKKEQRTECYEVPSKKVEIAMAYGNLAGFAASISRDVLKNKYKNVKKLYKYRDERSHGDFEKPDNILTRKYMQAEGEQRRYASYENFRLTAERKVRKDEAVVKSGLENNTDSLMLAQYFLDAFSLNRIKSEEEHLADDPKFDVINSVRTFMSENNTSTKLSNMQNSSVFKNICLLQNTPMFKNVLDEITAGNVKNLDDIMKLMPAKEVEEFFENYFENINQTVNEQKEYQEEALSKFALMMDHPVKSDYKKLVKQLIVNAGKFSDTSIDNIAEGVDRCFDKGAKEKDIIRFMGDLEKIEQDLSEQMLDDDSDGLREKYAFVINLQSKLEAYMDADEFIKEAKSPTSVYASSYDRIKYRIEKIEQAQANYNDDLQPEFKKLEQLAKESMEHIRDAIVSEATGHRNEGVASLRDAKDIGILAVYNLLKVNDSEQSQSRNLLEQIKVDAFLSTVMDNATALRKRCKNLNINTLGELLEDSNKLVEFFAKSPKTAKEAECVVGKTPRQEKDESLKHRTM